MELSKENLPHISAGGVVKTLSDLYVSMIDGKVPFKVAPSVMLWGPPGIGKSQAVHQLADEITDRTGKRAVVTDVRLLLFNPVDLRGIPTANAERTLAVWLKPEIFQMDASEEVVNILFLDEISAAPQSVQAAAYQITLDRKVGEHRLPDNCIVIAAGNRVTDKSVAYKMPKALANRLMHFEVKGSFEAWQDWAVANGINDKVLGFLSFRQDKLMNFDAAADDLAFATPRSWEMVSNILNLNNGDVTKSFDMIAGLIGVGLATELKSWERVYKNLPDIQKIFDGKESKLPTKNDERYALVAAMTSYARSIKDDMARIANSIIYADQLPPDYSAVLMHNYIYMEKGYKHKLMKLPEFTRWLEKRGGLLNGLDEN